jgi:hypothetical protein
MTTITITDPEVLKQLAEAKGLIEFRDPTGKILFTTNGTIWAPPPGYIPPISEEELTRRSQTCRSGISTAEVLRDLQAKYGA